MITFRDMFVFIACGMLIGGGTALASFPYIAPYLHTEYHSTAPLVSTEVAAVCASPNIPDAPQATLIPQTKLEKPRSLVWEVPPKTNDVVVTVYNADNSWSSEYTITNYIGLKPGQKIKVAAH